ncbi:MAG: serine hydrolase domain-containing protein [Candidatus Thorarchaeota archaeon]|jgi:CubicO group peptidase (beta-lactamase class C family)
MVRIKRAIMNTSLCLLLVLLLASGAQAYPSVSRTTRSNVERDYWPTDDWQNATPEEHGMDSSKLDEMIDYIEENNIRIHSILAVRDGYVVLEEHLSSVYDADVRHQIHSCTKSFTSTAVGIAIEKGFIESVDTKILDFFPNRTIANVDDRKQNISIKHLLMMTSGLEWDEWSEPYGTSANQIWQMFNSGNPAQYVLDRPMAYRPGDVWVYNSGGSHLLSAIVEEATGQTLYSFLRENMFEPLGISVRDVHWPSDAQGVSLGGGGIYMKPKDMAKFGYLYLNNGSWNGSQIIAEDWISESTQTSYVFGEYSGYGYQWWTNQAPDIEIYSAQGFSGQFIFVVPENDLVVIFTSDVPNDQVYPHPSLLVNYILPALGDGVESSTSPDIFAVSIIVAIVLPLVYTGLKWTTAGWQIENGVKWKWH